MIFLQAFCKGKAETGFLAHKRLAIPSILILYLFHPRGLFDPGVEAVEGLVSVGSVTSVKNVGSKFEDNRTF